MGQVTSYEMLIDGKFTSAKGRQTRNIIDPATNEVIAIVPEAKKEDTEIAILAARKAFDEGPWRQVTALDRSRILMKISNAIREKAQHLAEVESRNVGKPIAEALSDVFDAVHCFEFYAGLATKIHGETMQVPGNSLSFVIREPIGVCGQIVPWNFPIQITAWKIAPALAAGNCCVLKPSEFTPLTALELAKIFHEIELPAGVVNIVTGVGADVGAELTNNPLIDKVSFTGGTETGKAVMRNAASSIKNVSLELGGKNPNIVFADANFDAAIDGTLFAAFANSGQVCSAASRLLVERSIHKKFVEALVAKMPLLKMGHGINPEVKMGPLVSKAHLEKVEKYIQIGIDEKATLACGGKRPTAPELQTGFFMEPTIFDNVTPNMTIAREEIFGPVLAVIPFDTEEEAIRIANDTEYGLAAGVWSTNINRALRVVKALRVGVTWINAYHTTFNELPWGGYKQSGIGRELGFYGIEPYMETKQVNINLDEAPLGWY